MQRVDTYRLGEDVSISIAPGWGCNLFSWKVCGRELMYCPSDYPDAAFKITGGGNPVLFPSVGRTWDRRGPEPVQGRYFIHGLDKQYHMPSHGINYLCGWENLEQEMGADYVTALYGLVVPEQVYEENYPFRVSLKMRYTLHTDSVELESVMVNEDDKPAPVAFGYHPYFRISNPRREGVTVELPIAKRVVLTTDTILPTGETEPADGHIKLQPSIYYDAAYTGITGKRMSLVDEQTGHTICVDYEDNCEMLVLYSPDDSEFVCIEPWTRGLGAYEKLSESDWVDGKHIPVLEPGEEMRFRSWFRMVV